METIAFYSYKGGVGRSLLVANAARFLGMLGKRVVALDLDFEAPGLHYKLGRAPDPDGKPAMTGGAVPYLVATAKGAKNPPPLQEHMVELALPEGAGGWLRLMPAGPAPRREYWIALKQLRERLHFDDPSGKGLAALLDLHARIQDELQPDYLLIDARTGVTELGGLATTALANCVVCLLVANQESVDGTLAIVGALKGAARLPGLSLPRVVPVVARATGDMSKEGRTAEGIKRLVEIGEGRDTGGKKGDAEPFVLPHDNLLGASDRVVGGERKASAFSPLHKAYLELFQHLFPQARKKAEEALQRLEAVANLKERLTKRRRGRFGYHDAFEPWEDSAIEEGVVLKSRRSDKTSRYADLVCRNANGEALMVVEWIPEEKEAEALEHWKEHSDARCVILLCQQAAKLPVPVGYEHQWAEERIYCRSDRWEKLELSERYDPPFPKEFDIYENPGDISIDQALEALHRGHEELVPAMVAQWRECMAALGMGMHGPGPRWRPVEARRILEGLAATEKTEVAVQILRHAAKMPSRRSDFDDFDERHGGGGLAALTEAELFAPLLWRLPVEAAMKYLGEPDSPFWTPCLAGHRLLAEEVMGLVYDPLRSTLKEADSFAAQVPADRAESDDEEERTLHRIYRQFYENRPRLCEDPPPLLLWDQQLREHPYWFGNLEDVGKDAHDKAKELLKAASRLRAWLRGKISEGTLVTGNLLGRYDPPSGRIELYPAILDALASQLGLQPRYLKSVVFIHLSVLATGHQARDFDGQPGFGFAVASTGSPFQKESPAHIALSQYFTYRLIERLGDMNLMGAFEKLSDKQPEPYRRWHRMRHIPVERMRAALLRARLGEAALELPCAEPEG
jgi:hypothetical protein